METKTEIIMFTSPTCSACKAMYPIVEKMKNGTIIDVTEDPKAAMEFGIRGGLPVFIKKKNGIFDDRLSGAVSAGVLTRWAVK